MKAPRKGTKLGSTGVGKITPPTLPSWLKPQKPVKPKKPTTAPEPRMVTRPVKATLPKPVSPISPEEWIRTGHTGPPPTGYFYSKPKPRKK